MQSIGGTTNMDIKNILRKHYANKSTRPVAEFWFFVFLLSCSTLFGYNIGIGTLKLSQIVFVAYCVFNLYLLKYIKDAFRLVGTYTNFVLISIIVYGLLSLTYSVDRRLTMNLLVQLVFDVAIFYIINLCFSLRPAFYRSISKKIIIFFWLFVALTVTQYFLAFIIPSFRSDSLVGGLFGGIKPGLFFQEGNWWCNYVFFVYYAIYLEFRNGDVSKKDFYHVVVGMIIVVMLTLSRILMVVFLIHFFFYFQRRSKILLLVMILLGISVYYSPLPRMILPERYTYDLYDTESNPRYIDSYFLINGVDKYGKEKYGFGMGTLAYMNDDLQWSGRSQNAEVGTSINVLPIQIYYDYGIVGLLFFTLIFVISLLRKGDEESKFIIFASVLCCTFHMPGYMNFFWLFMGYFYFLINIRPIQKNI